MEEVIIKSAFDFFDISYKFRSERGHVGEIEFYRGHSNKDWNLIPSISRKYMLDFEAQIIDEFIRLRPDYFIDDDGYFNILAKMQHHGLHTRLLDITENPAVALYFACCDNFNDDGEIFVFTTHLDELPNNTVLNLISYFYVREKDSSGKYNLRNYYDKIKNKYPIQDVKDTFYYLANGYSCFARPKVISERILRQSGSFMLFGNRVCPDKNCFSEKCRFRNTDKCERDKITEELIERIDKTKVCRNFHDITERHIKNSQHGVRYIVNKEYKEKILRQLDIIGIRNSFLFPELNNYGVDIMRDYYQRLGLK